MIGKGWAIAFGGLALAGVTAVAAQDDKMLRPEPQPEAIIYRDAGYQGPAVNVSQPQPNLGLAWRVGSIRVRAGRWQVCERANYRGDCQTIATDRPVLGRPLRGIAVQSMRPLGWNPPSGEPGRNPSLRGMAAEFYSAPARGGFRVQACSSGGATATCAARTADQFCSAMGWRHAVRQGMETVRGRVYLADVLCSNTGY
ncbi:MAG: beta/gamma crystallin-related protein [Erythrobacter sp.]